LTVVGLNIAPVFVTSKDVAKTRVFGTRYQTIETIALNDALYLLDILGLQSTKPSKGKERLRI